MSNPILFLYKYAQCSSTCEGGFKVRKVTCQKGSGPRSSANQDGHPMQSDIEAGRVYAVQFHTHNKMYKKAESQVEKIEKRIL